MSELAIIFSDLHVHQYRAFNEDNRRLKNCISVIDYVFSLAHKNDIKYIIFPGDLYNNMEIISTKAVNAVIECLKGNFQSYPTIRFIAISGNHDYSGKNLIDAPAISAMEHLATIFDNFHLLDAPGSLSITDHRHTFSGVPYFEYPEHFRQALANKDNVFPTEEGNHFLLTHQVVASGLPIEDHIEATDPLFDKYQMIFNGHIHKPQEVTDKFINVGSPLHRDAGDVGQRKGIWIVDLDDPINTLSFKDLTDMWPQYIQLERGSEPTPWEAKQYIIWVPPQTAETVEDKKLAENFRTDLKPETIIKNYGEAVGMDKETLEYGLKLLV